MEAVEERSEVTLALKVARFLSYGRGDTVACDHALHLGGVSAKFRVTVDLYSDRRAAAGCPNTLPQQQPRPGPASPAGAAPSSVNSPRLKKSSLKELYTYGGIAEVIYGDSSEGTSPAFRSPRSGLQRGAGKGVPSKYADDCSAAEGDHCDVGIEVTCLESSVPSPLLSLIQITTGIQDRPEQERAPCLDSRSTGAQACWRGILVPRISVRSYDLLLGGALNAWVRFRVPQEVLQASLDGLASLSSDMRILLDTCHSSADALLLTSDGGSLPAHLAILRARSALLSTCYILNETECNIGIMVDGRSPSISKVSRKQISAATTRDDNASSSGLGSSGSCNSDSEDSSLYQTFECPKKSKSNGGSIKSTPQKKNKSTAQQSRTHQPSPLKKKPALVKSPSKLTSSERLALFSRAAGPSKRTASRELWTRANDDTIDTTVSSSTEATKDLNQCFIECDDTSDESVSSSLTLRSDGSPRHKNEEAVTRDVDHEMREKFRAMNFDSKQKQKDGRVMLKVNMSTSVTEGLLEWIYTGQCRSLGALCRPLLVAGRLHGVPELAAAAEQHLAAALSPETAPSTLLLAHQYQAWPLLQRALEYARDHAALVTGTRDWERAVNKCPDLALRLTRVMTV